jgi:DNA-binding XRE family transcriptional regulator
MKKSILEKMAKINEGNKFGGRYVTKDPINFNDSDIGYKYFLVWHNTHQIDASANTQKEMEEILDNIIEQNTINEESVQESQNKNNEEMTKIEKEIDNQIKSDEEIEKNSTNKIVVMRRKAGMPQWLLAELIDCDQKDISRWENGHHKPTIDNYKKLANALNCKIEDLI